MRKLTVEFIESALCETAVWNFANSILYNLCKRWPDHTQDDVIIAKFWLIGRAYAAAAERRRQKDKFFGDDFYVRLLAPKIRISNIDQWFEKLKEDMEGHLALRIHKKLTDFLHQHTGLDKRSLASKYLHFHFPKQFFLYDSRANKSVRQLTAGFRRQRSTNKVEDVDATYAEFCRRCQLLTQEINNQFGKTLGPRELDNVLLHWSRKTLSPRRL